MKIRDLRFLRYNSFLAHRSKERIPTKIYNQLTQFNQSSIKIQPRIEYLALYSRFENYKTVLNTKYEKRHSKEKLTKLLEPVVFHIVTILDNLRRNKPLSPFHEIYFNQILNQEIERDDLVCNYFNVPDNVTLQKGVKCFKCIANQVDQGYNIQNLISWIQSIKAKSILESSQYLNENTPSFILFDVLLRNPKFKEEYLLQQEIWLHNLKFLITQKNSEISIIKSCLDNLVYYCLMFEPASLENLITKSMEFFHSKNSGLKVTLGDEFVNNLIWNIALYSFKYNMGVIQLTRAQEILISYTRVNYKAYMGIALVISRIDMKKSGSLLSMVEKKFSHNKKSMKEMVSNFTVQLNLCQTGQELVHVFNMAMKDCDRSSTIWLFFIRKLASFDMLDSRLLLSNLIDSRCSLTSDIISELIQPIEHYEELSEICQMAGRKFERLFMNKYLQLLAKDETIPDVTFPWDQDVNKVNYSEYVKQICGKLPNSIHQLGLLMSVETPTNVFKLYKQELLNKGLSPNLYILTTLIKLANKHGRLLVDKHFASQIAIFEFKQNVKPNQHSYGITPSEYLWHQYVQLLIKYEYLSELSKLMKWWVDLNFTPSKKLLTLLLKGFPREIAERHIKHHQKINSKDWNWPTNYELYH